MRNEPAALPEASPAAPTLGRLFSIGHSTHELADLIRLLQRAEVTAVADVRSHPFSRHQPQFNQPELERGLKQHGIAYVFLGDLLGGRPQDPSVYDDTGRVDYERVRATAAFQAGLERLIRGLERFTIAMLCSEKDPLNCHRGLMIAPALVERGLAPLHLRNDGTIESTEELEDRLVAEAKLSARVVDGVFAFALPPEKYRLLIAEALHKQSRRKAFRRRPSAATAAEAGADEENALE
jgi:uncharacterized protein (DUF488 family)